MGKQVRFFTLLEDERLFLDYVANQSSTKIIECFSKTPEPEVVTAQDVLESNTWTFYLWNTHFPVSSLRIQEFKLQNANEQGDNDTSRGFYVGMHLGASVIEYRRSSRLVPGEQLVRGRLWADKYAQDGLGFVYQGDVFKKWYDDLSRWIRKRYERIQGVDGYLGSEAVKWYQNGGRLYFHKDWRWLERMTEKAKDAENPIEAMLESLGGLLTQGYERERLIQELSEFIVVLHKADRELDEDMVIEALRLMRNA